MAAYVGEIRLFGGNFAPSGWMFCEGQLVSISENETLFNLIGTTYGGDGQSTFALPDLRGRVPVHMGNSYPIGQLAGSETTTVGVTQLPPHAHSYIYQPVASGSSGTQTSPQNAYYAGSGRKGYYGALADATVNMASIGSSANTTATGGVGQFISLIQPLLVVSYIISLYGVYPTQS